MNIADLGITQECLRNLDQLPEMIEYVKGGGQFTLKAVTAYCQSHNNICPDLIEISRFEDGKFFLRNGHHRTVAIYLANRTVLYPEEYNIIDWNYADFDGIHFLKDDGAWLGWVTPFDVRTHVRIANLSEFKKAVKNLFLAQGSKVAAKFIRKNQKLYCERKRFEGVAELAALIRECLYEL